MYLKKLPAVYDVTIHTDFEKDIAEVETKVLIKKQAYFGVLMVYDLGRILSLLCNTYAFKGLADMCTV